MWLVAFYIFASSQSFCLPPRIHIVPHTTVLLNFIK